MEWELFEKIASELAPEKQTTTFMFALHNEPLLDKRIFDWVKHVKSINPDKHCAISTNGELLDKFSLRQIAESGLDRLSISLNAYLKETYESINTGLDYDRVIKNIYYVLSDRSVRQKVELRFVLIEENAHEVQQAVSYWRTQKVHTKVRGITNRAGSLDNYERFRLKDAHYTVARLWRFWKRVTSVIRGVTGCDLPFYQMNVLFNGDVIVCCHDWNRTTVVGNLKTSSLREVWNSERMNEIRRLILRKRYGQINSCRECSLVV
jgi:radical SAM protein with 4Fe4S-binding SPASM domain